MTSIEHKKSLFIPYGSQGAVPCQDNYTYNKTEIVFFLKYANQIRQNVELSGKSV